MKQFGKLLMLAILSVAVYKGRYQLLNCILSNRWLRKMSVSTAMKMPGVREKFISSAFRK
ncbi:hypothetical protein [Lederbergia lenta]|uniref:Na+/H+ antiporter n=1 Tax=Lederbergia lenta TaxID=1467 RepID=A0A2X4VVJ0_LEDLE|nr:hypothetical protein [Lederbergia lenta]MCM3111427.1 hypothetical protein [Lederbergia lenta]MEC2325187.1 hypothetical protein [Lederbergia lenta]SQI56056.1 Na+/H+ antiporter [Lederbergia lenta]